MDRRTFLKIAGMGSLTFAASCTSKPEKRLYSLVEAPDDMVTGKATWYATTCRECPAGCGVLAKNREGRVVKVEGNPLHPINKGRLCMRGQAALQGIYNPDRIKTPMLKERDGWRPITFSQGEALLREKAEEASQRGEERVRILTEAVGKGLFGLFMESLHQWRSGHLLVFEPYGYESLKTANQEIFGVNGLISYRMEEADFLVSFGADFLETWLSPVEYAWKFKEMHALQGSKKGMSFHVGPYQSLTCANADLWLPCSPGSEAAVALGLIREALRRNRETSLPKDILGPLEETTSPYTAERVIQSSGIPAGIYERLVTHLFRSLRPLFLGGGTGASGPNDLQVNMAANLLNRIFDPDLSLLELNTRHRVEIAAKRSEFLDFLDALRSEPVDLLLLNNVNPVYSLADAQEVKASLERDSLFVVSFSNFMDETSELADLILPVTLPLESWDEYGGKEGIVSTLQPTMGSLTGAPHIGDLLLRVAFNKDRPAEDYLSYLYGHLIEGGRIRDELDWLKTLQRGGVFQTSAQGQGRAKGAISHRSIGTFKSLEEPAKSDLVFIAAPSIRFFDGRGANRPWLCEVPDPLTKVAWQTPVLANPQTLKKKGMKQGEVIRVQSKWGRMEAPVYGTEGVRPGILVMGIGQGHGAYGRYAKGMGLNPFLLLSPKPEADSGAPQFAVDLVSVENTGRSLNLAHTDGSRLQHGRKIALTANMADLAQGEVHKDKGLGMWEFPFTMPLPQGYDERRRDFYPPHEHKDYRWAMVVDLDRCIGCAACAVACYAENNVAVVKEERIIEGREMAWLQVQRYEDPKDRQRLIFLPMLCQHCDDAPCESVCPVFAPHHNKEGINNQIYNRCIGTRFCSQDCPYKVRRFNWFDWQWPEPLNLQLNPDVTVRGKGVMEKCSFCIQRIKDAHDVAKNENRKILDGEVQPACVQTCPARVFTFGNLMDPQSEVRRKVEDKRAYQVMGYLNTKPAVIYLKKVVQEI